MARTVRMLKAPKATGETAQGSWRQLSGSMGAVTPDSGTEPFGQDAGAPDKFETTQAADDEWARHIAMKEAAAGLATPLRPTPVATQTWITPSAPMTMIDLSADPIDLSALPDAFSLRIERKGETWKVTAPDVHVGLWKAGANLPRVVEEALGALAEMVSIDGVVTKKRRGPK